MAADKESKTAPKDCPPARYTHCRGSNKNEDGNESATTSSSDKSMNIFGNGWTEEGRQRYCELMLAVNESRAFFNRSFNLRMMKYAAACELQEKKKRARKPAAAFSMTSDFALPSVESVIQSNPNPVAEKLNLELMNCVDELPEDDDNSINKTAI